MQKMTLWPNFDECKEVRDIATLAKALAAATQEAEDSGCAVELGDMEIFDTEVIVTGSDEALTAACAIFEEYGFTPNREDDF